MSGRGGKSKGAQPKKDAGEKEKAPAAEVEKKATGGKKDKK